jgi:AbrB family looped-hinge helix DNA binding protein
METVVDADGKIVLPGSVRRKYGIQPGMKVILTDLGDAILLLPVTTEEARQIEDEVLLKLGRRRSDTKPLADTGR